MPAISIRFSLAATYRINKPVTSPPHSAAPGVKIVFSDGTGPKQTLYYFSQTVHLSGAAFGGVVSEASADKGKQIVKIAVNRLTELIQTWLSHPDDPGSW